MVATKAIHWFERAAAKGHEDAKKSLEYLHGLHGYELSCSRDADGAKPSSSRRDAATDGWARMPRRLRRGGAP